MAAQQDPLPPLNARVLAFVQAHMGQRVDRGECWDLAAAALDSAGAVWDHRHDFGRLIDPEREAVLPGDIVQFEKVEFRWKDGLDNHVVTMPHHTAIIVSEEAPGEFAIAHQNMQGIGRKVGLGRIVLEHRAKGIIRIHRPLGPP